ncbi:MAG: S26 family signal peptidase [Chloroflexi bacterium]|nr:S26 family signal peptidase [Chloroflexota bacterium]
MFKIMRVTGDSLSPEFEEGDFVVLATSPLFLNALKPGDVLVFQHEQYGTMIKKFAHNEADGKGVYVTGAHPHSLDSSQFGPIPKHDLIGKVIWHIAKPRS